MGPSESSGERLLGRANADGKLREEQAIDKLVFGEKSSRVVACVVLRAVGVVLRWVLAAASFVVWGSDVTARRGLIRCVCGLGGRGSCAVFWRAQGPLFLSELEALNFECGLALRAVARR